MKASYQWVQKLALFDWTLLCCSNLIKLDYTDCADEDEDDVNSEADHKADADTDTHGCYVL